MKFLDVKTYPDPCLRVATRPVECFDDDLKALLRSMGDVMYLNNGIGLAGTQVGLSLSVLVVDIGSGLMNFVNPEIIEKSGKKSAMLEGCLSLPGIEVNVKRPEEVQIRAQNENGGIFVKKFDGLAAKALQHEIDHLQGKLLIDYLDPVRRFMAIRKLSRSKRNNDKKTCEVVCNVGKRDN